MCVLNKKMLDTEYNIAQMFNSNFFNNMHFNCAQGSNSKTPARENNLNKRSMNEFYLNSRQKKPLDSKKITNNSKIMNQIIDYSIGIKKIKDLYKNLTVQGQSPKNNQPSNMTMQYMSKFDNTNNVQSIPQEDNMVKSKEVIKKSKFNFFNNISRLCPFQH